MDDRPFGPCRCRVRMAKYYYMRILSFLILFFAFWAPLSGQPVLSVQEEPTLSYYEKANLFYQKKAVSVWEQARSVRDQYNAAAFAQYPRIAYQDVIPGHEVASRPGFLFKESLLNTWAELKVQSRPDVQSTAQRVFQEVLFTPALARPSKEIRLSGGGDIWSTSLRLSSLYVQLGDYVRYIQSKEADYQAYLKHKASGDMFFLSAYKDQDFAVLQEGVTAHLFFQRQKDIELFVSAYTRQTHRFISQVLLPLQTNFIEGADIEKYLRNRLSESDMPSGISKESFIRYVVKGLPGIEEIYNKVEKQNPSFAAQMQATYRFFSPQVVQKNFDDFLVSLSLFEYISPGTLVDRLDVYGKIPSRDEALAHMAAQLAAAYFNQKLAEIASGLYEYEKPFYYSYAFGSAEKQIGENWYKVATQDYFSAGIISQIATDNLLQSGRREYQTPLLHRRALDRKMVQHVKSYRDALPMITDVIAGDMLVNMAVVWPFSKGGIRATLQATKGKLGQIFSSAKKAPKVITRADLQRVKHMVLVQREEGIHSAVWRLADGKDETLAYLKYGSEIELQNTKRVGEIIENSQVLNQFKHLEVQYPQVLADGMWDLPDFATYKVVDDFDDLMLNVRSAQQRMQIPFVMTPVDSRGISMIKMYMGKISPQDALYFYLGGKPITQAEWGEIMQLYRTLNQHGFIHDDLRYNLFIMRNADGKLRLSIIDFEPVSRAPKPDTDVNTLTYFHDFLIKRGLAL